MRVIAGKYGGRRLADASKLGIRPMLSQVKESVFDIIGDAVDGAAVLDLFAGTGQIGIEAISRGARNAVFVENSAGVLRVLRENIGSCSIPKGEYEILRWSVFGVAKPLIEKGELFDIIFCDPPFDIYDSERLTARLNSTLEELVNSVLAPDGIVEIHGRTKYLRKKLSVASLDIVESRVFGQQEVLFATCCGS